MCFVFMRLVKLRIFFLCSWKDIFLSRVFVDSFCMLSMIGLLRCLWVLGWVVLLIVCLIIILMIVGMVILDLLSDLMYVLLWSMVIWLVR